MSDNSSFSYYDCYYDSNIGITISVSFLLAKMIVILFLSILILYVGYQQWQQQRSMTRTSHSDIFTYNMIAVELIFVLGSIVSLCGIYASNLVVFLVGLFGVAFAHPGELFFNIVTCVERYLAVVHPVTYLGLRQSGGVRIRNICIGCVWLLCFAWLGVQALYYPAIPCIPYFSAMAVSLIIIFLCCLSVLCVLNRPGPGELGGDRKKIDQSKQKAFYTITSIMVVLLMSFLGMVVVVGLNNSYLLSNTEKCVVLVSGNWFTLPTSLILPLLFLQRRGKLSCSFLSKR